MACSDCRKKKAFYSHQRTIETPNTTYSPNIPSILKKLNMSVLLCAEKENLILHIKPNKSGEDVDTEIIPTQKPLSIAGQNDALAVATKDRIFVLLQNEKNQRSNTKGTDSYSISQSCFTNNLNVHDLAFTNDGNLLFANPIFSCISQVNLVYDFQPVWQPSFITDLQPDTRCFLNGLAIRNGKPRYVTMLAKTNESRIKDLHSVKQVPCCNNDSDSENTIDIPQYWDTSLENSGVLIDIENESTIEGLSIPNSPRWHNGNLYFIDSGRGKLCKVDFEDSTTLENAQVLDLGTLPAFAQGLDFIGNLAFIGISPLRRNEQTQNLPIVQKIVNFETDFENAQRDVELLKENEHIDNDALLQAIDKEKQAKILYQDAITASKACGLWIFDISHNEPLGYYEVDNIQGINALSLIPMDAMLSLNSAYRHQKTYRTAKKKF